MTYLLDTDTLIFLIRGLKIRMPRNDSERQRRRRAEKILGRCRECAGMGSEVALSAITAAELEHGARNSGSYEQEMQAVRKVLSPFSVAAFDGLGCARAYGEVRHGLEAQGVPIGAMDLLIAAHAKGMGAVLVSNNRAHFARIEGLEVENWSE